jgi:hypothetical protein
MASMMNRLVPSSIAHRKHHVITGKCVSSGKGGHSHHLLFSTGRSIERVTVAKSIYKTVRSGDSVVFVMRSGFLGFPVVDGVDQQQGK